MLSWLWSFVSVTSVTSVTTNKNIPRDPIKPISEDATNNISPFIVEERKNVEAIKDTKPVFTNEWEEVHYVRQNLRRVNSTK